MSISSLHEIGPADPIFPRLFFVPTAIYAYMNPRGDEEVGDVENTESRVADERTPLLEGRG